VLVRSAPACVFCQTGGSYSSRSLVRQLGGCGVRPPSFYGDSGASVFLGSQGRRPRARGAYLDCQRARAVAQPPERSPCASAIPARCGAVRDPTCEAPGDWRLPRDSIARVAVREAYHRRIPRAEPRRDVDREREVQANAAPRWPRWLMQIMPRFWTRTSARFWDTI